MDEDWEVLSSCLPSDWREQAAIHGALKGLRKDKSADVLLRMLLMHLGCGHSLRETATRARQAGIADMSDVALFKRLRKSKEWLRALCVGMYRECGVELGASGGFQVRAFDGSVVKEPGRTGSLWRVHYSLRLPALACDHFEVTRTEGGGCGESLSRFPIEPGDHVVADRGYSTASGLTHVDAAGGYATVRVNTQALRFRTPGGRRPFDLLAAVSAIGRAGAVKSWRARAVGADGKGVVGRVCAMRKSPQRRLARRPVSLHPREALRRRRVAQRERQLPVALSAQMLEHPAAQRRLVRQPLAAHLRHALPRQVRRHPVGELRVLVEERRHALHVLREGVVDRVRFEYARLRGAFLTHCDLRRFSFSSVFIDETKTRLAETPVSRHPQRLFFTKKQCVGSLRTGTSLLEKRRP